MQSYHFMFWNINLKTKGKDYNKKHDNIHNAILTMSEKYDLNFILLVEAQQLDIESMLQSLNHKKKGKFSLGVTDKVLSITKQRFVILHTVNNNILQRTDDKRRILSTAFNINGNDVLINLVHLRDKYNYSDKTLDAYAQYHAEHVRKFEIENYSEKSLIVGDFNLNPYQDGMMNVNAFNAIMSPNIVEQGVRKWNGKEYKYFYNPSWNVLGKQDNDNQVFGTYYYDNNKEVDLAYWYMLDQLILRKDLLKSYQSSSLKIISNFANVDLLNEKGIPDEREYSDHLPVKFTMKF
ncbi:hypothetical protein [Bacillus cereus]|uniref:hypothetical protein n=1 Tax=Bacillus cereus TaxID=1396 RepID=UPI000B4B60BD|nr:hypothetical protein [Bacillus cereus]